jgi:hypothetical protein
MLGFCRYIVTLGLELAGLLRHGGRAGHNDGHDGGCRVELAGRDLSCRDSCGWLSGFVVRLAMSVCVGGQLVCVHMTMGFGGLDM